jgi:hypothetical protein
VHLQHPASETQGRGQSQGLSQGFTSSVGLGFTRGDLAGDCKGSGASAFYCGEDGGEIGGAEVCYHHGRSAAYWHWAASCVWVYGAGE